MYQLWLLFFIWPKRSYHSVLNRCFQMSTWKCGTQNILTSVRFLITNWITICYSKHNTFITQDGLYYVEVVDCISLPKHLDSSHNIMIVFIALFLKLSQLDFQRELCINLRKHYLNFLNIETGLKLLNPLFPYISLMFR